MSRHHIATITPQWSQMYSILTECTSPLGSLGTFSGEQLTEAASHGATPALMGLSKEQLAQIASGHASPLPPYAAYSPLVVPEGVMPSAATDDERRLALDQVRSRSIERRRSDSASVQDQGVDSQDCLSCVFCDIRQLRMTLPYALPGSGCTGGECEGATPPHAGGAGEGGDAVPQTPSDRCRCPRFAGCCRALSLGRGRSDPSARPALV
jgi:hypothetical protein